MAFLVGVGSGVALGSGMVISAEVAEALAWEVAVQLPNNWGQAAFCVGKVAQCVLPILFATSFVFSAAAHTPSFVAVAGTVAGIVPGLVIGLIVVEALKLLMFRLQCPGAFMRMIPYAMMHSDSRP